MLERLQKLVAIISGIGFAGSLVWHLTARGLITKGLGPYSTILFPGLFVVWFPTVLYLQRFQRELQTMSGLGGWKYIATGAPAWLAWLTGTAFVYGFINFFLVIPGSQGGHDQNSRLAFDIGASGHAMVFYSAAALVNWAAVKRREDGIDWVCERGHALAPTDKFCSECGAPAKKPTPL